MYILWEDLRDSVLPKHEKLNQDNVNNILKKIKNLDKDVYQKLDT